MVFEKRTRVRSRFFAHHMWKQTLYHLLNTILSTIFVLVIFFVILLFVMTLSRTLEYKANQIHMQWHVLTHLHIT